jgi:hypothetical protein
MMDSIFRPWSSRSVRRATASSRTSRSTRRDRRARASFQLESLEGRRLLAFQYLGIDHTAHPGTPAPNQAYQWEFQVYNATPNDPATMYVRQNDVLGRIEFDTTTSFGSLPPIPELVGFVNGVSPPRLTVPPVDYFPPSVPDPTGLWDGTTFVGPGFIGFPGTGGSKFYRANWIDPTSTTLHNFYLSKLRVTCAPGTVNPTFVLQTGNTFPLALEVDFSNAAPGSTGRIYINAPLDNTSLDLVLWQSTYLDSWDSSYEFMANEIYIRASVDPKLNHINYARPYLAAGPSPDYTTALTPTPPQVPPTGLIQIENRITGGLTALVATGDFKMLPNSSVTQGSVSVQLGAGQTPALPLSSRWGYGGNGGDILIDGTIDAGAGSVLLQVNSLDPRNILTSNTGSLTGFGSLNLFNMGADGGSIDVRTADFTSTNIFAGSPLAGGISGQATDISINVNQTRGNLVIDALPASRGAISLKASDTNTIQINANYDSKASLSLEAGTLNVARPISTTSGDITLIAKDTVTVSSNLAAGNTGVGNVVITSTTGNVNLTNAAVVTAPGEAIVLSAPLGLIDSKSRLQAARLEATAATTIVANTAVDVVKAVAGNTITINDIDALTVESMTAKALTVTANGLLTLADLTATGGDITATTAVGGLAARKLETKNGSITLRADAGDVVIDGTVLVGDTGSPRTKDASITATTGNILITSTSSVVVPDQLVLDAVAGRVLTPGKVSAVVIDSSGSDYASNPSVTFSPGSGATATPAVGDGQVTGLRIDNGGTGYTTPPQLVIDAPPAGGTRATAVATVSGGVITGVRVVNPGSGYKTTPAVQIVGGSGANGRVVATINGLTNIQVAYPSGGTSYQVPPLVVISSGTGGTAGAAAVDPTTGAITSIAVSQPGGGYTSPPTVNIRDTSGSGFGALAVANLTPGVISSAVGTGGTGYSGGTTVAYPAPGGGGTTATGKVLLGLTAASFDPTTGIVNGGTGYATGDLVEVVAGTGARLRYDVVGGSPTLVVLDGGQRYTVGDTLYLAGSDGTGLEYVVGTVDAGGRILTGAITVPGSGFQPGNILVNVGGQGARYEVTAAGGLITGLTLLDPGSGYTNRPTTVVGGSGSGASLTFSDQQYQVVGVAVVEPGTGYTGTSVTPSFSGGAGSGAAATGILGGVVGSITVTAAGQRYNPATTVVTLTSTASGGGASASAVAVDGLGAVRAINLAAAGTGYVAPPTVTIVDDSGVGYGATAVATMSGNQIIGFDITSAGYGYNPATTRVVITPIGTGATAEANLTGGVLSIAVLQGGSGYDTIPPVVTIAAPAAGGQAATATAVVDPVTGAITSFVITNPGFGYAAGETPVVTITGGNGDADGEAVVGNIVGSVRMTNSGSGYSAATPPTITFVPYGSGAAADAFITPGGVTGYRVDNGGSGYLAAPQIVVTGDGLGAEATATVLGGAVTAVRPTNFGTGYTFASATPTGSSSTPAQVTALVSGVTTVAVTNSGAGYVAPPAVFFDPPAAGGLTAMGTAVISDVAQLAAGRLKWRALEKPLNAVFDQFSIAAIDITGSGDLDIVRASGDLTLEGATTKDGSISVAAQKLTVTGAVIAGDFNSTKNETVSLSSLGNDLVIDAAVTAPAAVVLSANAGAITSTTPASAGLVTTKDLVISSLSGAAVRTKVETVRGIASGTGAAITVTETNDITLGNASGDLVSNNGPVTVAAGGAISVGRVDAGVSGSVVLTAATNILDATGDPTADIVASAANLTATAGKIDLDTDVSVLSASSPLSSVSIDNTRLSELALQTVTARNDVRVATAGPLTAATVSSTLGNVLLTAGGDLLVDTISAVSGRVTLEATGRVGPSDPLGTKANVSATGARVTSASTINLRTAVGSLGAQAPGAITIVEDDAITLGEPNGPAQYKQVISTGSSVGVTAGGTISAVDVQAPAPSAGITLTSTGGGVVLGSVAANRGSGIVTITAKQSITDNDPAVDLIAAFATLTSTDGSIGSASDAVDFDVSVLQGTAYRDIRFTNPAATPLSIAGLASAGGDIVGSMGGVVSQIGDITAYGFVSGVANLVNGSGYSPTNPPIVTISAPEIPGGRTATATASVDGLGRVTALTIVDGGSGYLAAPTVTIAAPPAGTQARATAVLTGGSVRLTAAGGMTQAGGAIKAATLAVSSTVGVLALTSPTNDVDSVSLANGFGNVSFVDADGFTVASPGVTAGGAPAGDGSAALTALTGSITLAANVTAINDRVTLDASNGLLIPAGGLINATTLVWFATQAPSPALPGTYTVLGPNLTAPGDLPITSTANPLVIAGASTRNGRIDISAPSVRIIDTVKTGAGNPVTVTATSGGIDFDGQLGGIVTAPSGSVTLTATSGAVTAANKAGRTTVRGGALTVNAQSADLKCNVQSFTSTVTSGGLTVSAVEALALGAIQAAGQTVTLSAVSGITQPTGSITAKNLAVTNTAGPVTLTSPANDVTNLSIVDGSGNVSFANAGSFSVVPPGVSTGTPQTGDGDVYLRSVAGGIAINASIAAPGDRVTLDAPNGSITQAPGTTIDSTSLVWFAKSAPNLSGSYTVAGPNLTSPGSLVLGPFATPVTIAGASTVDGDITITAPDVLITDPVIAGGSGRSITVTATNGNIGVQSKGLLQTSGGPVSLSATKVITATNAASVTTVTGSELALSSGGAVTLSSAAPTLGTAVAAGPLTLLARGAVAQKSGAIVQATRLDITGVGGPITLANAGNNVSTLSVRNGGGAVSYRDLNELRLDTIVGGAVTLNVGTPAVSGPALSQTPTGSITATALAITSSARGVQLPNAGNDVDSLFVSNPGRVLTFTDRDDLTITGLSAGNTTLVVGGNLTQTAAITSALLTINATGGAVSLPLGNDVDTLSVTNPGRGLTFTDVDDLAIGVLTAGAIGLTVGGNLSQGGAITGSSLAVTASAGTVSLVNGGNNVATATIANGNRNVNYVNAGPLALGGLTMGAANLVVNGNLTQTGPITGGSLGITSLAGTINLPNPANNLDGLAISNGGRLVSYNDSNNIAITTAGTLAVGTVRAAGLMTITTANGGGVDVGPQANGLLQAGSTLDLRGVQGSIGIRNGGRIVGSPTLLPAGQGIQVGGAITNPAELNAAVATINSLPIIPGANYEILVSASMTLTQQLTMSRPVTFRGTSQSIVLSGSPSVVNGLVLDSGASGSVIRDLAFSSFSGDAIRLTSAASTSITGIRVSNSGNGLAITGTSANVVVQGNTFDRNQTGVSLVSATGALIGGLNPGQGNVISNAVRQGVFASGFCNGSQVVKNSFPGTATPYNVSASRNLTIIN